MEKVSKTIHPKFMHARGIIAGEYDGRPSAMQTRPLSKIELAEASALGTLAALEAVEHSR
jgi:predicted deacylase